MSQKGEKSQQRQSALQVAQPESAQIQSLVQQKLVGGVSKAAYIIHFLRVGRKNISRIGRI